MGLPFQFLARAVAVALLSVAIPTSVLAEHKRNNDEPTIEFPTASHVGGITLHANQFARLIERAVEATAESEQ
jgi:hypothetical protein